MSLKFKIVSFVWRNHMLNEPFRELSFLVLERLNSRSSDSELFFAVGGTRIELQKTSRET